MHEFTVWAPRAQKMAVQAGDQKYAMSGPDTRGWWKVRVETADMGTDYGFLLDDDETVYPDPRSQWQPNGVHGMSRLYDQKAFEWHDGRWQAPPLASAILYELHIGTFTPSGTFDSAIDRLDYLCDLGVTHIEIMPVAAYAGDRGWGYDGVALFAVTENYGGPDALKRFVDACHVRGLAVVLDVVYNHFGPVGAYSGKFGPYLTDHHCTPWGDAVNFESQGSDEVRRFFCDNALMWLRDFHIDGLRLDAVHEFVDRSAVHFLEQLSAEVEVLAATLGGRKVLIAESDLNDPRIVRPREALGYGIDAQWSDDFHHALFTLLHFEDGGGYYTDFGSIEKLAKSLNHVFVYDGEYSTYRQRKHGRPVDGLSAHHFLGFIQNHDQVGNRATGDRLADIVGADSARVAAGILLTAPFVPLIFQGEEYAASTPFLYFADHEDAEMAKAVSEGRKKEFAAFGFEQQEIPDPEARGTFERSRLNWDEIAEQSHKDMLDWYRALIRLRRNSLALNDGDRGHLTVSCDERKRWMVVNRGAVRVFVNLGTENAEFEIPEGFRVVLSSRGGRPEASKTISIAPNTVTIISAEAL
ncbi:MAG TPA: malto-oligosyltrehalose trehalohydrolase [Acidobacteriaceae bacterium]|nr:malto-oligosyltrehalose trehalohydrolase [Acidobacteriaceae bacterium]